MFGLFPIQVLGAECSVELLSSYKRVKINLLFTEPRGIPFEHNKSEQARVRTIAQCPLYSLAQLDKHATNVSSL